MLKFEYSNSKLTEWLIVKIFSRDKVMVLTLTVGIFLLALVVRLHNVTTPETFMVDEAYYVPAANSILSFEGDPNYVHPPFGKILIAAGIAIFGYNPLGWRIASVLAGSSIISLTYLAGRRIFNEIVGASAAALLIVDPLEYSMSKIAMLDILLAFFVTLAFASICYDRYYLSAVSLGLACGIKLVGVFAVAGIIAYLVCSGKVKALKVILPLGMCTFFLSIAPTFSWKGPTFTESFWFVVSWHTTLAAHHPSASHPYGWMFNLVPFPLYSGPEFSLSASANPIIYPLSIPVALLLAYESFKTREVTLRLLPVFWIAFVYGLFFILPRKTQFIFYLTPNVPAIALLFSYGVIELLFRISK
ncbi:MAG: phospholipid carrier-dependent glycosyltransferase [Candidatus Bathyarchaeia archaeon]|nr:glycosyltransferase family 39 protein [Candidatus Bathyarchaeota archaeon]